ncbi:UvrB/UvrC motif-containing protein [bacterium]|nr:UvrB/UvrC motif-containing protein [bacterium]
MDNAGNSKKERVLCQKCHKNPAQITVIQVIGGQKTELKLCEKCAQKAGYEDQLRQFPQNEEGMISELLSKLNEEVEKEQNLFCPNCGLTFLEFKSALKFGCANCYEAFEKKIVPMLSKIHHATWHVRRKPGGEQSSLTLKELENKLEQAVKDERFEEAAQLRDLIKEQKNDLG